ncbi:hypothetical protein [Halomonas kalidii]|uniref:Apea-like HEPN domain-containing protein n=1 Tax=Halomonas kalidii TaxID=3043293 RepID=A0ABT6VU99_9GAMM|nr:hypothetical protein [Halomonas kalidii]MDI5936366.1 hypothetical protein [Halomonas kalidii]
MFTLRYPFKLQEGREISDLPICGAIGSLIVELRRSDSHYIVDVSGFDTREDAEKYVSGIWVALTWLLIEKGLAHVSSTELQPVSEPKDPEKAAAEFRRGHGSEVMRGEQIHGILDAARPAVIRTAGTYRTNTANRVGVLQSVSGKEAHDLLVKSLHSNPHAASLADVNLLTALDLYCAHYTEASVRAKLLTLTMVLEVLAKREMRPKTATCLLHRLQREIRDRLSHPNLEAEEAETLRSLSRELDYRTRDSIRSAVRTLIMSTYQHDNAAQAHEASKRALKIYDVRSKLVHEGYVEGETLGKSLTDLTEIVKTVLRHRLRKVVHSDA